MIIATAGHIDHGKTSLVKAITGTDADRLKEEKARGITIDLGFAYWLQPNGSSIGFVDVPGHEGYVHNMLAGVTGVQALLLIVAANDGIMPQTREHLMIADLLDIRQGIVALSKADLASDDQVHQRIEEIAALLSPTALATAPIIPVSTTTGLGLDRLKQALQTVQADMPAQQEKRPFRLAVDRVFSLPGTGTVVTGSVLAGRIALDDRLLISPSGQATRVRGLHAQNRRAEQAGQGDRVALNLAGTAVDAIGRGDMLLAAELHTPTQRFDASLRLSDAETRAIAPWTPVHLHTGTGVWNARIVPLSVQKIEPGSEALVQIVPDRPIAVFGGDRFILRDASGRRTLGGGIVLDIQAPERHRRRPERLQALAHLTRLGGVEALPELLALPPYAFDRLEFSRVHGLGGAALDPVITRENLLILAGSAQSFIMASPVVLRLSRRIQEMLAEHHAKQPDQAGLAADRLRLALPERLASEAFAALTAHLQRRGELAATGTWLRLPGHVPRLSVEHEALWALIHPLLATPDRFKPPRVNELTDLLRRREETVRGLLKRLARRGDVDEVAQDHFLLRSAVAELAAVAQATDQASPNRWFNAATFRDRLGIGRKMAILVLEFFDRQGLTIRKGDLRRIDPRKRDLFREQG